MWWLGLSRRRRRCYMRVLRDEDHDSLYPLARHDSRCSASPRSKAKKNTKYSHGKKNEEIFKQRMMTTDAFAQVAMDDFLSREGLQDSKRKESVTSFQENEDQSLRVVPSSSLRLLRAVQNKVSGLEWQNSASHAAVQKFLSGPSQVVDEEDLYHQQCRELLRKLSARRYACSAGSACFSSCV
ncbi:hypothetical protein KP509_21G071700 [Ceratopteris richardii]|nr:hypothetical protein KP509_21G071700 [Ceratopteris richardii]